MFRKNIYVICMNVMSFEVWNMSDRKSLGLYHILILTKIFLILSHYDKWPNIHFATSLWISNSSFVDNVRWYILKVFNMFLLFYYRRCNKRESLCQVADVMLNPYWIPFLLRKYLETRYILPLYLTKRWKRWKCQETNRVVLHCFQNILSKGYTRMPRKDFLKCFSKHIWH